MPSFSGEVQISTIFLCHIFPAAVNFIKPSTRLNSHQQQSTTFEMHQELPLSGHANANTSSAKLVKWQREEKQRLPLHPTTHQNTCFFCSPCSELFVDFLVGSDSNWNRPISSKDSQLKHRVDTLAFSCAFCYGILIPCCLLYLYGKQHMVLEVNRTRTVT